MYRRVKVTSYNIINKNNTKFYQFKARHKELYILIVIKEVPVWENRLRTTIELQLSGCGIQARHIKR